MTLDSKTDPLLTTHADLVYAAALRQTGNPHTAADITQAVLILALRKARENRLPEDRYMTGWFLKMTHYAVKESNRAAARRARHERIAAEAREEVAAEKHGVEGLDAALLSLSASDREALIRRYLQNEPIAAVATALGTTENGASKRIARALEKLRQILQRRGVSLPVAMLSAFLTSEALVKAPPTLAATTGASTTASALANHILRGLLMAKAKVISVALAVGLTITITGVTTIVVMSNTDRSQMPAAGEASSASLNAANDITADRERPVRQPPAKLSPLAMRYNDIFRQMTEAMDGNQRLATMARLAKNAPDRELKQTELLEAQVRATAACWNHIEEAVKEVAMRHGVDISALDSAPPMPTDLSNIPVQDLTHIISKRMVIPLTDQTAQEVLDLVNKRYAASRIVTTQQ